MDVLQTDFEKAIADTDAAEKASQQEFDDTKSRIDKSTKEKEDRKKEAKGEKATEEGRLRIFEFKKWEAKGVEKATEEGRLRLAKIWEFKKWEAKGVVEKATEEGRLRWIKTTTTTTIRNYTFNWMKSHINNRKNFDWSKMHFSMSPVNNTLDTLEVWKAQVNIEVWKAQVNIEVWKAQVDIEVWKAQVCRITSLDQTSLFVDLKVTSPTPRRPRRRPRGSCRPPRISSRSWRDSVLTTRSPTRSASPGESRRSRVSRRPLTFLRIWASCRRGPKFLIRSV
jgi:hypothetical protein